MIMDGIAKRDFLVIGRVGMDIFTQTGEGIVGAAKMITAMGGSSANIAAGLVKLGCKAALVTCVSDDAVGAYCLDQLDRYGINRDHVRVVQGQCRTSLAVYETRLQDHHTVIYRNDAADFRMDDNDISPIDFGSFGAVITTGTVFAAEPSRSATMSALRMARDAGVPVIFDVDYRPYSWPSAQVAQEVLSQAADLSDIIVGNDEEFGFMAGHIDQGLAKAQALAKAHAAIVVYKKGPDGSTTFQGDQRIDTGIYPVDALKPTGAGDSFMAGLLSSLGAGLDLQQAIQRGSACASITVSRPGCAPAMPTPDELDEFMAAHLPASAL
jgi:5-dehydro-2-deoxygluconokinase